MFMEGPRQTRDISETNLAQPCTRLDLTSPVELASPGGSVGRVTVIVCNPTKRVGARPAVHSIAPIRVNPKFQLSGLSLAYRTRVPRSYRFEGTNQLSA